MNSPILFLIFNRPETTSLVFEKIRQQRPDKLYIAADGPRNDINGEKEKCEKTKNIVLTGVDWHCEVKTLFREENLGCGSAVSAAVDWFFNQEEYGIILEDDCLPNESFFSFCNELLIKYATEEQVMMISGCSFQQRAFDNFSYYYSRYIHVWGWATWRRAWKLYEFKPTDINVVGANGTFKKVFSKERERKIWIRNIHNAANGKIDTWDYQWMYAIWKNNGFSIVPWKNLISNIGYGEDATHTTGFDINTMALPAHQLNTIKHPLKLAGCKRADKYIRYKLIISNITLSTFIKQMARKLINYKKTDV